MNWTPQFVANFVRLPSKKSPLEKHARLLWPELTSNYLRKAKLSEVTSLGVAQVTCINVRPA